MISLAWIVRDLDEADQASHLWWTWSGLPFRASGSLFGSSLVDLVLLVLCVVVGISAQRSPAAAGALGTVAAVTLVLRLPSLWNLNADWMQGIPDDLKTRADLSAWAGVVLAGLLLATVAAARRPADGYAAPGAPPAGRPPGRPGPGAAVTGAVLLGAAGAVLGAWQIYWAQKADWDIYKYQLTGKHTLVTLLSPPAAWESWALVAFCLAAAVAALARAPLSRPLGMVAAVLVLATGVSETSLYGKLKYLEHFGDLPTVGVLSVLTAFFELLAGLVALIALARRGGTDTPAPAHGTGAYGTGADGGYGGAGYAPPPAAPPGYAPPPPAAPPTAPPTAPPPPPSPPPGW
ncbi:hypothetical protein [Streptomyces sp. NBRC 110028]|uniref:hypothetical protein n=1 Tax=Streptomyces sp. NBRC 110028 TaxID=1621260 RepID=UPI001F358060|nr:hypothetical protein [Streptomyces sp. NBRC 110028]